MTKLHDKLASEFREAARGMGRAIRYRDETPLPDEPYMSMQDAAQIHAKLIAQEREAQAATIEALQARVAKLEKALSFRTDKTADQILALIAVCAQLQEKTDAE